MAVVLTTQLLEALCNSLGLPASVLKALSCADRPNQRVEVESKKLIEFRIQLADCFSLSRLNASLVSSSYMLIRLDSSDLPRSRKTVH